MEHNFVGEKLYDSPDPNKNYYCYQSGDLSIFSRGFTILMKWVLLTKKNPFLNEVIEEYVKKNPQEINKKNNVGLTALMLASMFSRFYSTEKTIQILLKAGSDANLQDRTKWTALMYAVANAHVFSTDETVKNLLAHSNLNLKDINNLNCYQIAIKYSCSAKNVELILEKMINENPDDFIKQQTLIPYNYYVKKISQYEEKIKELENRLNDIVSITI